MTKAVALISGGIDSPLAAYLASRRMDIVPLHFCLNPFYCESSFELLIESLKALRTKFPFEKIVLYPWGETISTILHSQARRYMCVICRRAMFKAAELICKSEEASAIVTGEALGQKASQTLQNLSATSHGVTWPILRPLIGLDKVEIQRLSRRLGVWRDKHTGCCSATPSKPATGTKVEILDDLFEKLNIQSVIENEFTRRLEIQVRSEEDLDIAYFMALKEIFSEKSAQVE